MQRLFIACCFFYLRLDCFIYTVLPSYLYIIFFVNLIFLQRHYIAGIFNQETLFYMWLNAVRYRNYMLYMANMLCNMLCNLCYQSYQIHNKNDLFWRFWNRLVDIGLFTQGSRFKSRLIFIQISSSDLLKFFVVLNTGQKSNFIYLVCLE
jgi:hypothetical protein